MDRKLSLTPTLHRMTAMGVMLPRRIEAGG